jgi:deoxyhypusine synthase
MPMSNPYAPIKDFMLHHYRHFNARTMVDAAEGWVEQLAAGNKMFLTLAGAMSTAELGLTLAELIRRGKVHGISATGANVEEDLFNLVAHPLYKRIRNWRNLTPEQETQLAADGWNRVTDTCIPEHEAMRVLEKTVVPYWQQAEAEGEGRMPHEFFYRMIRDGALAEHYTIDPRGSWLVAAAERDLPLFVPGWEDSTLGNMFVSCSFDGRLRGLGAVKSGVHYMRRLVEWYREVTREAGLGFFQIGGGIAGDFPICVVPLITQDLQSEVRVWSYFCQISDSTTSYGSYSGAVPNEKITWGKLDTASPKFIIESDATIVAPLVFAYVLAS